MPIYEFRCTRCGKVFEELQIRSDADSPVCPECGGASESVMSQTSYIPFCGRPVPVHKSPADQSSAPKQETAPTDKPKAR